MDLDVWPALVTAPEGTVARARVMVDGGRGAVIVDKGGQVAPFAAGRVTSVERAGRRPEWTVTLDDGWTWTVRKASGCGCGRTIRRLGPDALRTLVP